MITAAGMLDQLEALVAADHRLNRGDLFAALDTVEHGDATSPEMRALAKAAAAALAGRDIMKRMHRDDEFAKSFSRLVGAEFHRRQATDA